MDTLYTIVIHEVPVMDLLTQLKYSSDLEEKTPLLAERIGSMTEILSFSNPKYPTIHLFFEFKSLIIDIF